MTALVKNIPAYALTLLVFLALDLLWLGVLSKDLYRRSIGHLMSDQVNWTAAVVFYLIFLCGLFILVIHPSFASGSVKQVVWMSAVYGLCTYATYDLTNLATESKETLNMYGPEVLKPGTFAASALLARRMVEENPWCSPRRSFRQSMCASTCTMQSGPCAAKASAIRRWISLRFSIVTKPRATPDWFVTMTN